MPLPTANVAAERIERIEIAARRSVPEPGHAAFVDYFRCPQDHARIEACRDLSTEEGYFAFDGVTCFGRRSGGAVSAYASDTLPDASDNVTSTTDGLRLPFDLTTVVTNLRQERYRLNGHTHLQRITSAETARQMYYFLRPMLGVGVRRHLQKIRLSDWKSIDFPRWPLDVSADTLMKKTMARLLKERGVDRIPFIWFWPDGARSCAVMTHDVEGAAGRDFCDELMDLDDAYGIKAAFQLVPEGQERVWSTLAERMRRRGFEINLHDLNHDGYLFSTKDGFMRRAERINRYAREFNCAGFRSGAMYREQQWYDAFEFSYDMSVPNVAHLEAQRGGCCTVMPYFVGNVLELPLTTIQDYSLFHILGDYSIALWKQQVEQIIEHHGLVTFLAHPDYISERRARTVYVELLSHLRELRRTRRVWVALPAELDRWWRSRHEMKLVQDGARLRIVGGGSHRARVAYAALEGDDVAFTVQS